MSLVAHGAYDPRDQGSVFLDADGGHADAGRGQSIPHGGELLRRPPAPGISGAGMQGDQGVFVFLNRTSGLSEIPVRHREAWLQVRRTRADQAHNLKIPEYLRLVVDVGHVAVKGYCLRGSHARRDPCPEPANERVGVAPAAVHLERQVEPLLPHAREEALQFLLVLVHARIGSVDPRGGWDGARTLDRLEPSGEKLCLKGATEQRDLCPRISLPERPERRQCEDEIAEPAGPENGDLAYALYPFRAAAGRHGGRPSSS